MPDTPLRTRIGAAIKAASVAMRFGGNPYASHWVGRSWGLTGAFDYTSAVGDMADNTIVAATIGWIGRTYPEAPIRVVRETDKGDEPVPGHPLTAKLKRPNPHYGYAILMKATVASYVLDGNAYWLKERTLGGDVLNYWYVPPWTMQPSWPADGSVFIDGYSYSVDGKTTRYAVEDVVHLRDELDPRNLRKGLSRLKAAIRLVYTDNAADDYASAMLRNFGTPSVIISPATADQTLTIDEAAFVSQNWQEKTTGENRGKALVSLAAVKVDAPGFSPAEMDVRSLRWTSEERISAILGIPAIVIGLGAGLEHGTFQNTAQAREAAYESFLLPTQASIADQLTTQLMSDFDEDPTVRLAHDYSAVRVLQPDTDAMYKRIEGIWLAGMIDRATAKRELDFETLPEDTGVYLLPRGASLVDGSLTDVGIALGPLLTSGMTVPEAGGETVPVVAPPAKPTVVAPLATNGKKPTDAATLAALTKS